MTPSWSTTIFDNDISSVVYDTSAVSSYGSLDQWRDGFQQNDIWNVSAHCSPYTGASLQIYLPSTLTTKTFTFLLHFTTRYSLQKSFGWSPNEHFNGSPYSIAAQSSSTGNTQQSTLLASSTSPSSHGLFTVPQSRLSYQYRKQRQHLSNLFASVSISTALESYWNNWHPNWPVMHKPTFSIEKTPISLLAAMIVIGSCYDDSDPARDSFDAVEEFIFNELHSLSPSIPLYNKIQSIQAAYLVCIFQTWEGGEYTRARVRRFRFGSVLAAVRELDIASITHGNLPASLPHFNWIRFVRLEECIRTLLWVFQLDTAYVIFNNMPPRMTLRELSMGLATPELAYQASSSEECLSCLQDWLRRNTRTFQPSLYGLIKVFLNPYLTECVQNILAHEGFMNLWCVNAAFHILLFNLEPVLGDQQFSGIRRGLENWEAVWNCRMMNNDEQFFDAIVTTSEFQSGIEKQAWARPGFWRNAAEYWLLAMVMLNKMEAAYTSTNAADELSGCTALHVNVSSHISGKMEDADMESLHTFLRSLSTDLPL